MLSKKTILVAGGAGFVGGCFVRDAIASGRFRIINVNKLTRTGNVESLESVMDSPDHVFIQGDIGDGLLIPTLLREHEPQWIVNFAEQSAGSACIESPAEFLQTNVVGVCRLLEFALEYWRQLTRPGRMGFRFLQVSTDAVYGSLHDLGTSAETAAFEPNTPYAASKAASDHFVRVFHQSFGLPTLTVNASNNYGPYQHPSCLIPRMVLHALHGEQTLIEGEGLHLRDWLHVEDHCRAIIRVLEDGRVGDTYNVSSGVERTDLEVVLAVCDLMDRLRPDMPQRPCDSLLHHAPDRPGRDARRAVDSSKLRYELEWAPLLDFAEALEGAVAWYLANLSWTERVVSDADQRLSLQCAGAAAIL